MDPLDKLIETGWEIASKAAYDYLVQHKLEATPEALTACLRSWVKIKLIEALKDAKEAFGSNMGQWAEATFRASMVLAGIEAAKEASIPPSVGGAV